MRRSFTDFDRAARPPKRDAARRVMRLTPRRPHGGRRRGRGCGGRAARRAGGLRRAAAAVGAAQDAQDFLHARLALLDLVERGLLEVSRALLAEDRLELTDRPPRRRDLLDLVV